MLTLGVLKKKKSMREIIIIGELKMQLSIRADSMKESAKIFKRKYPDQDIYDITRESVSYKNGLYRITSVSKGSLPKNQISKYNYYG